jgi:hypothetical protein
MRVLPFVALAALLLQPAPEPPVTTGLATSHFTPLPLTAVRPAGWLRQQLEIQARGLSGNIDQFWPDLGPRSGWLGGDGESWERGPYFMDGLVPLAFLLGDPKLEAKARMWIDWTIRSQRPDGWIGPIKNPGGGGAPPLENDWWPNMVMLKALMQYAEATGDQRIVPLMDRYFAHHLQHASKRPLKEWARFRWFEELPAIAWLYNRTKNPKLLDLARVLHDQGFDWRRHFDEFAFTAKTFFKGGAPPPPGRADLGPLMQDRALSAHGVNNAMALKAMPLWSLFSPHSRAGESGALRQGRAEALAEAGGVTDRGFVRKQLELLDRHHGLPNGMFSADEHYAGRDPSQGIELCAVVEAMYSLELALAIVGDAALADRLEKIAYNALPAAFSNDMWSHQYDQQPNQVLCTLAPRDWTTNGPESNLFGLEPHFGCCTANMHQGWPKLAAHLWMRTADDGLAAVAYAPSDVRTTVRGVAVVIREHTEYPFRETITLDVVPERPVSFPLVIRVPGWALESTLQINDDLSRSVLMGSWRRVERTWRKGDRVKLVFRMKPRVTRGYRNSVIVERGPLVFALPVGEEWRRVTGGMKKPAVPPAADWEVHPTTAWNYGLVVGGGPDIVSGRGPTPGSARPTPSSVGRALSGSPHDHHDDAIEVVEQPIGRVPFSATEPAVSLRVNGRRLPNWTLSNGSAGPLPEGALQSGEPLETLTLVPYGAAKLRVTAFPALTR